MKIQATNLLVMAALIFIGSIAVSASTYFVLTKNFEKERAVYEKQLYNVVPTNSSTRNVATAGVINGKLTFPSEVIPNDLEIYAEKITTGAKTKGQADTAKATFTISLKPGSYYLYATRGTEKAYYNKFITCGMSENCEDLTKIAVKVEAGKTITGITVGDWWNPVQ